MHSGFSNLRSALPMNIKARFPGFKAWVGARADINRISSIWRECLDAYGGPYLFGQRACAADAMYAPVCSRFVTYEIALDEDAAGYSLTMMEYPYMKEWIAAAKLEPDEVEELDVEF
jgi:glutathione S-transferase